jgi:hypothetical protein
MKRTLDDLRGALLQEADAAAYPDVDALVAGARRRVVASRRRRLAVLGAVTAAVLVVGGLAITRPEHKALPQPADRGPFTVNAGGAGFPEYSEGMKRLTVLDAPMLEQLTGSIKVPTTPGRRLDVRMTCTPADNVDRVSEWSNRMYAQFNLPGSRGDQTSCGDASLSWGTPIGLASSANTTVLADVLINHTSLPAPGLLFKDAKIHVAIYESVPWESYPFPPRPADLGTSVQYAWSSEPGTVRVLGPKTAQQANKPLSFTQPYDPRLSLNLEIRGPGRLRLLFDGKDISEQIATQTQDKLISVWGYGITSFMGVGDIPGLALKPGTPVTVTIIPQDFQGPDWRISVQPSPPNGG